MKIKDVQEELRQLASPQKAQFLKRYFKTGKGEYAEGDKFVGVTVPNIRQISKKFKDLPEEDILTLLHSPVHEERLLALLIMCLQFKKSSDDSKKKIYDLYLANTKYINNWDLVDLSAHNIIGAYLVNKPKNTLYKLAKSNNLWERRISIIATYHFITKGHYKYTFKIAKILLSDKHDLIHKAVGWMLREVGKRISREKLEEFLKKDYKKMPRTMLRYAIEHFPENKRQRYLSGKI